MGKHMVERDVCAIEALARSKGASCWALLPPLSALKDLLFRKQ